jgi:tetratricopeptide (TPR) repeat protein
MARQYLNNSYSARAKAYERLGNYSESLTDWDKAIELAVTDLGRVDARNFRAHARVRAGMIDQGIADVEQLLKAIQWSPIEYFNFACTYGFAAGKTMDKKHEYLERAMALLKEAVAKGYNDVERFKTNANLNSLRDRADFKQLVADLEKKLPAKPANAAPAKTEKR